jgi:hypothetical protein
MGWIELIGLMTKAVVIAVIGAGAFWLATYALQWLQL